MKVQKDWTTLDIHIAPYLAYRGIPIEFENLHGRVIFTAPPSDELYRLASAYNANDPVPVADYVGTLRALKARMFAMRGMAKTEAAHAKLPTLNPVAKYLFRRYKEQLLSPPYSQETSRIVDCIDFVLEAEKEARHE